MQCKRDSHGGSECRGSATALQPDQRISFLAKDIYNREQVDLVSRTSGESRSLSNTTPLTNT
jgi:hypothetical protein